MKKIFFVGALLLFFLATSLHATASMWPGDGSITLPALTGNIQVQNRQLLVDGIPFIMKGICYQPVRQGETALNGGLMTSNPNDTDLATIEADFQMMQAAGINTIRTYQPIVDLRILALLEKYHLRTIVPICPSYAASQDTETITQTVQILQNDPSTLMWEIGNEWNLNHFYTIYRNSNNVMVWGLSNEECLELVQKIATLVRSQDTTHPISTDITWPPTTTTSSDSNTTATTPIQFYAMIPDFVDLYGINYYNGLSFGSNFNDPTDTSAFPKWQAASPKPFYLGEYGSPAWNTLINAYDPNAQETAITDLTTEILNNLSAKNENNVLVGGCAFEFCDEWWKMGSPSTHNVPPSSSAWVRPTNGPWPDHCYDGPWFGMVDIDRNPRPAYFALQALFTQ